MEMINNVLSFPQTNDTAPVRPAVDLTKEIASTSASERSKNETGNDASQKQAKAPTEPYQLRLTVDKDPETGQWIYRAIDRYTGEVVREMPRQELVALRQSSTYKTGSVIKTDV
ncbi:MAG: flagellar biosynthesis protein FlaG [Asticcacaulis sp.]